MTSTTTKAILDKYPRLEETSISSLYRTSTEYISVKNEDHTRIRALSSLLGLSTPRMLEELIQIGIAEFESRMTSDVVNNYVGICDELSGLVGYDSE